MKTYLHIIAAGTLLLAQSAQALSIQWDNQGTDSDWNTIDNWSQSYLPGTSTTDFAVLAATDYVNIGTNVLSPANSVNLKMRAGASMDISADISSFNNMQIGYLANAGSWIAQTSGTVTTGGYLDLGELSTSDSIYEISGDAALDVNGTLSIFGNGVFSVVGEDVSASVGFVQMYNAGALQFILGQDGVGSIDSGGLFNIRNNSQLIIDLSDYWAGGGSMELVTYGILSGTFAPGDISLIGLDSGATASITYDSDSMNLDLVPAQDPHSKFWFTLAANAGASNAVAEDLILKAAQNSVCKFV